MPPLDHRMVSESSNLRSVQHGRKRVDMVLKDSDVLPAHAVQLVVSGSKREMHEHWRRAVDVYQKVHANGSVPCTIQVIDQRQQVTWRNQLQTTCLALYIILRSRPLRLLFSHNLTLWNHMMILISNSDT